MRMPILKYFLAALILIAGDASRAEAEIYSEAELHRDFAQLLDFIEETHPDLERGADLAALAQAASRARADLRDGMDQAQAWMAMAQINPWLGDGHSGIRRPSALLERHRDQLLPLAVEFDAAHRLIVSAAPSDSGLQPGTAVSAINGILLAQINARLLARMRGESALLRERLLARYFSDYHWLAFGASDGFEQIHYLVEEAFISGQDSRQLSYSFLHGVESAQDFDTNPIFAILHEAIYCQQSASHWAAARVRSEYPQFDWTAQGPIYFTGEMIYPWMFAEYRELRPLQATAEILAAEERWPRLYDVATLRANRVPCAAAVYYDDMYVERTFSEETAQNIAGLKLWITNAYEHNGLRADGEAILDRLIKMARGMI